MNTQIATAYPYTNNVTSDSKNITVFSSQPLNVQSQQVLTTNSNQLIIQNNTVVSQIKLGDSPQNAVVNTEQYLKKVNDN